MEQLMEELLPRRRRELIERVAGSVGEGAPKPQYLLELLAGVQPELIRPGSRRGWAPGGLRSGGKAFIPRRDPNGDLGADIRGLFPGLSLCDRWRDRVAGSHRCGKTQS